MGRISRNAGAPKIRCQTMNTDDLPSPKRRRVGLLYDDRMCKHFDSAEHVENPKRIISIWNKLKSSGINQRCVVLNAKEAEDSHIALVHSKKHMDLIKNISSSSYDLRRSKVANSFDSIYFNKGSSEAACLAAGSVVEVAEKVARGELDSGFAIVRPPGHHAEANEPMGFCLLNNVAIAASYVLNERKDLGIRKILIVDWDIHHGNATQEMFWKDPRVLVFSVHRHENGTFYPDGDGGSYQKIGEGPGAGYNINVPWENDSCGDADYLAAWDHILIPVAKSFDPDLIIVASGFDAAINDPLGGCCVTPYGFSIMLSKLMEFAEGKIVMALEGGYNLESLANSSLACVETLLDEKPVVGSLIGHPLESTWRVIHAVREQLRPFWPILANQLPVVDVIDDAPGKGLFIPSFKKVTNTPLDTPELRADFVLNALPSNHIKSWLSQCPSPEDRHMAIAIEHLCLASISCQERKNFHNEMDEKRAALAKCHEDLNAQMILVNEQKLALEKKDKRIMELESALEKERVANAIQPEGQMHALKTQCSSLPRSSAMEKAIATYPSSIKSPKVPKAIDDICVLIQDVIGSAFLSDITKACQADGSEFAEALEEAQKRIKELEGQLDASKKANDELQVQMEAANAYIERFRSPSAQSALLTTFINKIVKTKGFKDFIIGLNQSSGRATMNSLVPELIKVLPPGYGKITDALLNTKADAELNYKWYKSIQDDGIKLPFLEHIQGLGRLVTAEEIKTMTVDESDDWKKPVTDPNRLKKELDDQFPEFLKDLFEFCGLIEME